MTNASLEETKKKEWLQLLEFIKRIYGEDKAEFIRTNATKIQSNVVFYYWTY